MNALTCMGVVRLASCPSFPDLPLSLNSYMSKVHEKKDHIVCMLQPCLKLRAFPVGYTVGLLSGYADIFFKSLVFLHLLFSIVSNGNVQINSSLLNPTDYCSNLK